MFIEANRLLVCVILKQINVDYQSLQNLKSSLSFAFQSLNVEGGVGGSKLQDTPKHTSRHNTVDSFFTVLYSKVHGN